jgi:hypothetical protein
MLVELPGIGQPAVVLGCRKTCIMLDCVAEGPPTEPP